MAMWCSTQWPRYSSRRRNIVVMWPTRTRRPQMTKIARHFPLQPPPYPYRKWVSWPKDEEEDEDGNGKLGLSNGNNQFK